MGDYLDNFGHKGLVWGDLVVPVLYKIPEHDGYKSVQLQVDVVAARERGQQVLYRGGRTPPPVSQVAGTEGSAYQGRGGFVG